MSDPLATEWYWDLARDRAVPADERGPGDRVLGPYRTKGEAENWRSKVESRNEAWDNDDEEWDSWESGDDDE
jgi:hypothetical protein